MSIDLIRSIRYFRFMKRTKFFNKDGYYETVTAFEGVIPETDGLFDDCPHCQMLRKQIEDGIASPLPPQWLFRDGKTPLDDEY